jgi:hypothetical protein
MAYSADGVIWIATAPGTAAGASSTFGTSDIKAITYANYKFVAVGAEGKMAYSANGVNWTRITGTFGTDSINAIVYGDKFVAVGDSGRKAYSADGVSWTGAGTDALGSITGIAYGQPRYVAVSQNGSIAISENGINNWGIFPAGTYPPSYKQPKNSSFGTSRIYGVAYGNGRFVAVGGDGRMAYSYESRFVDFEWRPKHGDYPLHAPHGNKFGTSDIFCIAYGNGQFIAGGAEGKMSRSWEGETWMIIPAGTGVLTSQFGTSTIYGIAFGDNKFVAVGADGKIAYSE